MDHRQYIEHYLSADVDGELTLAEQQAVSAHLATCAACRQRRSEERSLKTLLSQRIPIVAAPDTLRQKIMTALDAETAASSSGPARPAQIVRVRFTRRPLWMSSLAALAAAAVVIMVIMMRGPGRQAVPPSAFESAIKEFVVSERNFPADPALNSPMNFASALALEFGYPYVWDFTRLGLNLVGARIVHQPNGEAIGYGLYKGPRGSILCINFRPPSLKLPPGGLVVHGVRFYRYGDFSIGVVNYGSVFCYLVSRFTPAQMAPALAVAPLPKTQASYQGRSQIS